MESAVNLSYEGTGGNVHKYLDFIRARLCLGIVHPAEEASHLQWNLQGSRFVMESFEIPIV
jgi:hypothetical protein